MEQRNFGGYDETRAFGRLPNIDIEIVHRMAWQGQDEYLSVTMRAVPCFEAVARLLETANPLFYWTHLMRAAYSPWMGMLGSWEAGRIHRNGSRGPG